MYMRIFPITAVIFNIHLDATSKHSFGLLYYFALVYFASRYIFFFSLYISVKALYYFALVRFTSRYFFFFSLYMSIKALFSLCSEQCIISLRILNVNVHLFLFSVYVHCYTIYLGLANCNPSPGP